MGRPIRLLVLPALAAATAVGYFLPHSASAHVVVETAASPPPISGHWIPMDQRGPRPTTTTSTPPPKPKPPPSTTTLPRPAQTVPEAPRTASTPSTTRYEPPAQPVALTPSGGSLAADFLCVGGWESGGGIPPGTNDDTGNGYYGYFQFSASTWSYWSNLPGTANDYSYSTQLAVAEKLEQADGWGPWPVTSKKCGL